MIQNVSLEIETESIANILMRLKSKQVIHTKIDYLRPNYSRKVEIVFEMPLFIGII